MLAGNSKGTSSFPPGSVNEPDYLMITVNPKKQVWAISLVAHHYKVPYAQSCPFEWMKLLYVLWLESCYFGFRVLPDVQTNVCVLPGDICYSQTKGKRY